ncbi:MAG: hypothetical protein ACRC0L_00440 [Angustibacter sp.]
MAKPADRSPGLAGLGEAEAPALAVGPTVLPGELANTADMDAGEPSAVLGELAAPSEPVNEVLVGTGGVLAELSGPPQAAIPSTKTLKRAIFLDMRRA